MKKSATIALSGPRACGKSTIASHLVTQHGYTRIAFADALRQLALVAGEDFENDRIYLADLGDKLRQLMPNFLLEVVRQKVNSIEGPVVIEDVRFPAEVDFCRHIGAATIRLEVPEDVQLLRLKERDGKVGEEAKNLLACLDESVLDNVEWALQIEAVGDFKILAADLDAFSQTGNFDSTETTVHQSASTSAEVSA